MNDELKGKSGKVKVMYVRGDNDKHGQNPRTGKGGWPGGNSHSSRHAEKPRGGRENSYEGSPWRTVSRVTDEEDKSDHGGISGNSLIDPQQIRRQRMEESRVYGEKACQALFLSRRECIVRAWFIQSVTPRFRDALRWMAANRKAYHVVDDEELAKASGTDHHGGVCFLIKKRPGLSVRDWLDQADEKDCVLALNGIGNPYNLGGIVRNCAHFGANGLLVEDASLLESGAAVRTAEGGAEYVQAITDADILSGVRAFRNAGYTLVTTSSHGGVPLDSAMLPKKMVLLLESEAAGTIQQGDLTVSIGGTGHVESLNIAVASGILLAEWWRQNH